MSDSVNSPVSAGLERGGVKDRECKRKTDMDREGERQEEREKRSIEKLPATRATTVTSAATTAEL